MSGPLAQSETVTVHREADGSFSLTIDVPGKAVNVLSRQVLRDLGAALAELERQPLIPALVVRGGKKTGFLAGADLSELAAVRTPEEARALSEQGQGLFSRLADLPGPSVAVLHGPCLGGGLELALACDYRLVYDRPDTQLGLPEVELGLLPAWGGTVRLPRVVGLERALAMIVGGKRLGAREARAWGLADEVAATEEELRERFTRLLFVATGKGKRRRAGLPLATWRQWCIESNWVGRALVFSAADRRARARAPEDLPAPFEALAAVRAGIDQGSEAGLAFERAAAARLATSPACRNLVGLFLSREAARKLTGPAAEAPATRRLAVVGAGVMGAGIAQAAALTGMDVVVREVSEEALKAGLARIEALFAKAVARGKLSAPQAAKARANVWGTAGWDGFADAEVVIEAASEDLSVKKALFEELSRRCKPEAVLATNTSSLTLASIADDPRFAGMHFFNPVHKMPLVEVARGARTSEAAIARLVKLAVALGKTPVVVNDSPGLVVNRVLIPYLAEAVQMVAEGVGIAAVDRVMRKFGMMAGPLETLDQIGLDVAWQVARHRGEESLAARVFEQMAARGWLGAKSGRGFYLHTSNPPAPSPETAELARGLLQGPGMSDKLPLAARLAETRERLVLLTVNEAVRIREEKVAASREIDFALVLGAGWAPHRGGPLFYLEARGASEVRDALKRLADRLGPRFQPAMQEE
jgi:3-hydroxyacyl-CoA dehydrogenase/enoyl-CoA hydratase/3-hydroxybutyryl-CoA epimerase